jgi:hypothetical protein
LPNHSIEPLQLVRYSPGQYFKDHHDLGELFDDGSIDLPSKSAFSPPRRMVTILVYLNDLPQGCGGETQFPLLKMNDGRPLTISPKRGTALVWCNILKNGSPDPRVVHSGQILKNTIVPEGATSDNIFESRKLQGDDITKYAINIWACEE